MTKTMSTCSLCGHHVPLEHLRQHQQKEREEPIRYTINMIKAQNSDWAENDPTCRKCWDYYRQL